MKRLIAAVVLTVSALFFVSSASTVSWEGRAAVGSAGIFPGRGMYGLSRVFSVGEIVEVYNPVNQTKVTVVISNNTDLSGILILLSPEASDALGITPGSDSVVRVSKIPEYTMEPTVLTDAIEAPAQDPDISGEAAVTAVTAEPVAPEPQPVTAEGIIEEYRLAETETQLYPHPEPEPELPAEPAAELVPSEPSVAVQEAAPPAFEPVPEAFKPESAVIEEAPTVTPAEETVETVTYSLLPSEDRPPASQPKPMPVEAESLPAVVEPRPAAQPLPPPEPAVKKSFFPETPLKSGAYYVQLAYLRDSENVRNLVNRYKEKYPIVVNKVDSGFQVLVGPLGANEYNAVLNQFKNNGFKDAFVKKIK